MADASEKLLERNDLTRRSNYLVPHQANKRIIDATAKSWTGEEKVLMNISIMEIPHLLHFRFC